MPMGAQGLLQSLIASDSSISGKAGAVQTEPLVQVAVSRASNARGMAYRQTGGR